MDYNEKIKNSIMKKNMSGRYSLFSAESLKKYLKPDMIELTYDVIKEWDERCNLPIDLGKFLDKISMDQNNIIAFSRVYISKLEEKEKIIESDEIVSIATDGLANNGHVNSSGASQEVNSPSDVLSALKSLEGWINLVGSYKKNNAIILYSIPSKIMDDTCHFTSYTAANYLYNYDKNKVPHIKPEFLIGMIVKNNGAPDLFLTRDDMLHMGQSKKI